MRWNRTTWRPQSLITVLWNSIIYRKEKGNIYNTFWICIHPPILCYTYSKLNTVQPTVLRNQLISKWSPTACILIWPSVFILSKYRRPVVWRPEMSAREHLRIENLLWQLFFMIFINLVSVARRKPLQKDIPKKSCVQFATKMLKTVLW